MLVRVFTISKDQMMEIDNWKTEHNKRCSLPEQYVDDFVRTSKYDFRFRELNSDKNMAITVACNCGEVFSAAV